MSVEVSCMIMVQTLSSLESESLPEGDALSAAVAKAVTDKNQGYLKMSPEVGVAVMGLRLAGFWFARKQAPAAPPDVRQMGAHGVC
jgi:hypothetical protein